MDPNTYDCGLKSFQTRCEDGRTRKLKLFTSIRHLLTVTHQSFRHF
uniref:Uncharacterized protein n=1 Tax=Lepeophtheirus salmonis TaxID=72036 RepID=A0A0K2TQK9_LEPSM